MRHAVVDIGTNTCLMLIAEFTDAGTLKILNDVHAIARLGAGVDSAKIISQDAIDRLIAILLNHKQILSDAGTTSIHLVATSAMRDAGNRQAIIDQVKAVTGFEIELLSGSDESLWSFRGATCGIESLESINGITTLDIGGGSTELSFGKKGEYSSGVSMNIGAVRMTERFLAYRNESSLATARKFIRSEIEKNVKTTVRPQKLIAVAGTPTSIAAIKLSLQSFDPIKIHSGVISVNELDKINTEIFTLTREALLTKYPAIHPSRADILPAGALILQETLQFLRLNEFQVSTFGLRYGVMIGDAERFLGIGKQSWMIERAN
ncbi:MAG: Ppx/GppA family phosphatase [bacterium]